VFNSQLSSKFASVKFLNLKNCIHQVQENLQLGSKCPDIFGHFSEDICSFVLLSSKSQVYSIFSSHKILKNQKSQFFNVQKIFIHCGSILQL